MTRTQSAVCLILACMAMRCLAQEPQTLPMPGVPRTNCNAEPAEILLSEEQFKVHVQGIAADESGIYWSMFDVIAKTDWTGKVLKKARVAIHAGDCCLANGLLYVSVCPWGAAARDKNAMGQVHVFDADLNFVRKIDLPETQRPDGIAFCEGKFYICNDDFGRDPHPFNYVHVYDTDLTLIRKVKVDIGMPTYYGVQTLNVLNGKLLAGCYGDKGRPAFLDKDTLAVVEPRFPRGVSEGYAPVPVSVAKAENVCIIASDIPTQVSETKKTYSARARVFKYENGVLTPFVLPAEKAK